MTWAINRFFKIRLDYIFADYLSNKATNCFSPRKEDILETEYHHDVGVMVIMMKVSLTLSIPLPLEQHVNELSMKLDIEEILRKAEAICLQIKGCKVS